MKQLILASQSPRREMLLKQIGVSFKTHPSNIDENMTENVGPEDYVRSVAERKAFKVKEYFCSRGHNFFVVLAADTVVVHEGVILGKPADEDHAFEMLSRLSGRWHEVMTGVSVLDGDEDKKLTCVEITKVKMRDLSPDEIWKYIRTGEPLDKAGAYGIQGIGALMVERIEGCFYNVVGLPLHRVSVMLSQFGIKTVLG
ncbi:Maf-like protein [Thermoclostridium stercorarium subsp. stercorarium DSM 8532]|jgi:septum formation protein|uniref:dTTP/UTP pyrophosphatase n=2 Tax=Thermoclostridium stercorarium TaxID=1510 RepID=L7VL11_THES1|nr:Maf family protein [Thermoclostridium stercorarium]AGC67354.1 Maf-like protein [Thermoclostridium stercorarium subsp. stercorarium DSM 8532]AGI38415.1 MAF protein [Thermoclostridium stercorarium subsp. stercorarium DSM 8532]ANW97848.1 septum formation inhibitor Maf [Thermoclostridium stercorarium subsp. thermolacticum DSM 2910]